MKFRKKQLVVKDKAAGIVKINIFETGNGLPKVAILNGLHGLERSGAYLGYLYFKSFAGKGAISLIPSANPTSWEKNTRLTPEDSQDMNRVFPGNKNKLLSFKLADKLIDYLKNFDLVIDIHNFPKMDMPYIGVWIIGGNEALQKKVFALVNAFNPSYIWKLDTSKDEKGKAGSLVESLLSIGVPAFSLEAPDIEFVEKEHEQIFVQGMNNIVKALSGNILKKNKIPLITRVPALSPADGFFTATTGLNRNVKKGQVVGHLLSLDGLKSYPVKSPISGPVIFVLKKTVVRAGDRVVIIGNKLKP